MPDFKNEIRKRLAELSLSPEREGEIVEELSQHLEDYYEQALSSGSSEKEAEEGALAELREKDLLGTELRGVERRVPQNSISMGAEGREVFWATLARTCATGCGCCERILALPR